MPRKMASARHQRLQQPEYFEGFVQPVLIDAGRDETGGRFGFLPAAAMQTLKAQLSNIGMSTLASPKAIVSFLSAPR